MAFTVGAIAAKDGAGATIGGGLLAADIAGGGVGPWMLYHGLVDGIAGSNKAQVDASNRLAVLASLAAGTNNIGDVDVLTVPADPFGANADAASATGSISAKLRFIASTGIPITGTVTVGSHAVTNAGTFAVQPAGSVAHDGVGTGVNPVLSGGYASAAAPTDVTADGDAVRAWYLRNGAQAAVLTAAGALIGGDATNGLDVDVTRVIPGTSATHLGKAEDAAHASGDTGVFVLAVRRDTATSGAADGDYVSLNTDDLGNLRVHIDDRQLDGSEFETVAASQTNQAMGATGATGDYLREILVIPATTSPGNIQIKDGAGSAITVFAGGASSVSNLVPFTISLGLTSLAGAWQITTGANVSAIGIGNFT